MDVVHFIGIDKICILVKYFEMIEQVDNVELIPVGHS